MTLVYQRHTQDRAIPLRHVHSTGVSTGISDDEGLPSERLPIQGAVLHWDRLLSPERRGEAGDRRHRQVRAPFVQQADRYRVRLQYLPGPIGQAGQNLL